MHAPPNPDACVGERLHHRVRLDGSDDANADLVQHAIAREAAMTLALVRETGLGGEAAAAHSYLASVGFCVIPDVIPAGEVDAVRKSVMETTARCERTPCSSRRMATGKREVVPLRLPPPPLRLASDPPIPPPPLRLASDPPIPTHLVALSRYSTSPGSVTARPWLPCAGTATPKRHRPLATSPA